MENENIFDKVLRNVNIVDVVKNYVTLEPHGKNLFGLCPFHPDHSPSMSVSEELQIFNCFVCKTGGNAIKFIELKEGKSSIEAARFLAKEYNIDVGEFSQTKKDPNARFYTCMEVAKDFFKYLINNEDYSKKARSYLKSRSISDEAIETFEIGLSPKDNKALSKTILQKKYLKSDLLELSLANNNTDMFINRIIVPIKDENNRVIAFGGRTYEENDKSSKYMNSKETPIFKKGETLFNLSNAIKELSQTKTLIINEGYMDVIQAYVAGVKNSIALMGTSLTNEQASLIKKYTNEVILCLDGDTPGVKAVESVIKQLESKNINYSIVILENNMDPDEYIRKLGPEAYKNALKNNRIDKLNYLYYLTKLDFGKITPYNIESFKNEIFKKLYGETSPVILETYLKRLSTDLNVSYETLEEDFKFYTSNLGKKKTKTTKTQETIEDFKIADKRLKAEKLVVDYCINSYDYYLETFGKIDLFSDIKNDTIRNILIEIKDIYDNNAEITKEELICKLEKRSCYSGFVYDDNIKFSSEDLRDNLIKGLQLENIKEEIKSLKEKFLLLSDKKSEEAIKISNEINRLIKLSKGGR